VQAIDFYQQAITRVAELRGVEDVSVGSFVPWRDAGPSGMNVPFMAEGYTPAPGEENPRAHFRIVAPHFFSVVGVPLLAGRDFTDDDRAGSELVVIVSQSVAERVFPGQQALNRTMWWTDPYFGNRRQPRRIVGIVPDADDEHVVQGRALLVYHPVRQIGVGGRLFVRTAADPHALAPEVARVIRAVSAEQPVERAATLEEVRAQVLSPDRVNAFVFSGFAAVALVIAVVGVAGVLAFSVSARTREFGMRLALGSAPRGLLTRVLAEGTAIAALGIAAGAAGGYAITRTAAIVLPDVQIPGAWPAAGAAAVLIAAAIVASLIPARRASRVDVLQALRSE